MNKIYVWRAIARGVLLESLRRKDLWVIAILGMIIICTSSALGFFGLRGLEVFVKDLAVTVLSLFSGILAVLTSCRLLPDEIRNRTLYPLLARPISRFDLILGKYLGAVAATWIGFLCLTSLTVCGLLIFHVQFEWVMLQYVVLKMMGLALLCAVSLTFSIYMTPQAAATVAFIFAFGSYLLARGLEMGAFGGTPGMKALCAICNDLLPQYYLFDEGGRAANTNWSLAPAWAVEFLAIYAFVYSGCALALAYSRFRRQAI